MFQTREQEETLKDSRAKRKKKYKLKSTSGEALGDQIRNTAWERAPMSN